MQEMDDVEIKAEIDEIAKKIDTIVQKIDSLDPAKEDHKSTQE